MRICLCDWHPTHIFLTLGLVDRAGLAGRIGHLLCWACRGRRVRTIRNPSVSFSRGCPACVVEPPRPSRLGHIRKVCLLYHISGRFHDQLLDWGLQSFLGYRKFNYMGLILAPSLSLCISQSLSENTRLSRCFWKAPFCRAFVSMSAVFSSVPTC